MPDSSDDKEVHVHDEVKLPPTTSKWKFSSKSADGDVALKLFSNPDEMNEPIDPEEERRLIRKVDFMILPLIAVNYAFFYIVSLPLKRCWTVRFEFLWPSVKPVSTTSPAFNRCLPVALGQNDPVICSNLRHQR